MNINKELTTLITIALMLFSIASFSQTKNETVKQINNLYKKTYKYQDNSGRMLKIESVTLEYKTLVIKLSNGSIHKKELMTNKALRIVKKDYNENYNEGLYTIIFADNIYDQVLWCIETESDARSLKKALDHLIEILK